MVRYMKDLNAEIQSQHQEVTDGVNQSCRNCLACKLTAVRSCQIVQLRANLQAAKEECESQAQQIERQDQQIDALKAVLAQKRQALSKLEATSRTAQTGSVQPAGQAELQVAASMAATILSEMKGVEPQMMEFHAAIQDADAQLSRTVAHLKLMEDADVKKIREEPEQLTQELRSLYLGLESKHNEIQDLQQENSIVHARARALQQELASAAQQLDYARTCDEAAHASSERIKALETALEDAQARISLESSSMASPLPSQLIFSSKDGSPSSLKPGAVGAS